MRFVCSYILVFLLFVPVHTVSFVNTMLHLAEHVIHHDAHDHEGEVEHEHEHEHEGHEPEHLASESLPDQNMNHRHAPNQPEHSHDKDIWGLFSNPADFPQSLPASFPDFVALELSTLDSTSLTSDLCLRCVFRPPIA